MAVNSESTLLAVELAEDLPRQPESAETTSIRARHRDEAWPTSLETRFLPRLHGRADLQATTRNAVTLAKDSLESLSGRGMVANDLRYRRKPFYR